jgi:hypothetical protein
MIKIVYFDFTLLKVNKFDLNLQRFLKYDVKKLP